MADKSSTTIPLSRLARDPVLRAFFDRSGRGMGPTLVVPATAPVRSGGAAAPVARVLEMAGA